MAALCVSQVRENFLKISSSHIATALLTAAGFAGQAHAYLLTSGGVNVAGEGQYSAVAGAITTTFNDGLRPAGYASGDIVIGTSGDNAAPPNDSSYYFTVGPTAGTPATLSLGSLSQYFGFYTGSEDAYNGLDLLLGSTVLHSFTGTDFAALVGDPANGHRENFVYVNIFAQNAGEYFDGVRFSSSINAFESDNHAVLAVPEPSEYAMLMAGLLLMGFVVHRRRA